MQVIAIGSGFYLLGTEVTVGADPYIDIVRGGGPWAAAPGPEDVAPVNLQLATPLRIPAALVTNGRFSTQAELDRVIAQLGARAREFVAQVDDAAWRMLSIEVEAAYEESRFLGIAKPFGSAGAFVGADIRLRLWEADVSMNPPAVTVLAAPLVELAAHARISVASLSRAVSLVVQIQPGAATLLHIDADDLGVRFPAFVCTGFDVTLGPLNLRLDAGLAGGLASLRRLGFDAAATVQIKQTNAPAVGAPVLVLETSGHADLDWAVVGDQFNPAQEDLATTGKIAQFDVEIKSPQGHIDITGLALGWIDPGPAILGGMVDVHMNPIPVADGSKRLGPLEVAWSDVSVTPSHEGDQFGTGPAPAPPGPTLRLRVQFDRLMLRIPEDPEAVLTLRGIVEIDPSGTRLVALDLIAPFPLPLLARAASGMLRAGADVLHVLFDCAQAAAGQLEQLVRVLGRFAVAIGRAGAFIGTGLAQLGDLVARGLGATAELVGALFSQLNALLPSTSGSLPRLAIELRVGTSPLQLRQALITLREGPTVGASELKLLGLHVKIPNRWRPGLLVDFVTQPGAYLVLTCEAQPGDSGLSVASLSTDLWLDNGLQSRALRDVDGQESGPAQRTAATEPILRLDLSLGAQTTGAATSDMIVVLAGLSGGQTIFLQRMAGDSRLSPLPGNPAATVRTIDGPFRLVPLPETCKLDITFKPERILPLLGMGESGGDAGQAGPSFLSKLKGSLSNVVWVKDSKANANLARRSASVGLVLGLKAGGMETSITLGATLSLDTLALTFAASEGFTIQSQRIEEEALGLQWVIEQKDDGERKANAKIDMFRLGFAGGQTGMELIRDKARMQLRFNGLSSNGRGVVFEVETFKIGPGGLDLEATVSPEPVRLNGIDVPFRFTEGKLTIKGGRLVSAMIAGRGTLPPDLIGEADCTVALTFGQVDGEGIVLQSGKVELDKKSDPIVCHTTRFTLTISDLDIAFVKDGGYHFYYLVTGNLRFTPKPGEFESGLLQYLGGVEMDLERTPLAADPRVLLNHISFQKALNPKKSFNLFNLFTFELRGFGFHPASPKFDGSPAVNISGQIKFVEIGDVAQPSIDFHGLWIAPPLAGESLPRIKADGLGIDLNLKGAIRVRGAVIAVDPDTRTVEGAELAPTDYKTYGFLGRGEFDIPGWGTMGAALGFLELEHKDRPGERRKSFFFFADQKKLAVEIPTPVWTFYLREAGFGLGFRYTLDALNAADRATSVPKLISALDEVSKTQGDLHRFSAWKPEPDGDRVTLALKGALQAYPANKEWKEDEEEKVQNPFLFDIVAAIRSDFTLFMGLRGWLGTNYIDYLNDADGLRSKPGLRGYLYISAPQQRLLARMIGDSKGYIGSRVPSLAEKQPLRKALQSVDWSATLFIKPGLFHYELGWPNQLVVRLDEKDNMRLTVRGGMIFRAADDGLLWGYNIEADAFFRFGGEVSAGSVGVSAYATLQATLLARVLCYLSWRFSDSLVYGLIALDATLSVSFSAWMEVDLGLTSFTITIGFSLNLQLSAAVEVALAPSGLGARVSARVGVSVFGCTLSVGVGFEIPGGELDKARAQVQRFLALSITAEEPNSAPAGLSQSTDARLQREAENAEAPRRAPEVVPIKKPGLPPDLTRSTLGDPPLPTNFWCVLHTAPAINNVEHGYAMLVPQEAAPTADGAGHFGAFYAPARAFVKDTDKRDAAAPAHFLILPSSGHANTDQDNLDLLARLERFDPAANKFVPLNLAGVDTELPIQARWNAVVPSAGNSGELALCVLFDECYLADTHWTNPDHPTRQVKKWYEPPARTHAAPVRLALGSEEQRNAERDMAQRSHAATAAANPVVDGVHQTRAIVLGMFAEQFTALAETGVRPDDHAHVTDLGLVFRGPLEALALLDRLVIRKDDAALLPAGSIATFNPPESWFSNDDPMLASESNGRTANAIQLDWLLLHRFSHAVGAARRNALADAPANAQSDPEHFLHHYELVRTVEGQELTPRTVQVKPVCTLGKGETRSAGAKAAVTVTTLAPECQYADDLADLPADMRRALLPASDEATALDAAIAWRQQFQRRPAVSLTYTVTPIDVAGTPGLPKSFLVDIPQPVAPVRAAQAELRFIVRTMRGPDDAPYRAGAMPPDALAVVMALKDPFSSASNLRKNVKMTRRYRLIADPETVSPSGYYGTDGLTERAPDLGAMLAGSADASTWELDQSGFVDLRGLDGKIPNDTFIDPLEPNHDTLEAYPFWRLLAGDTGLPRVQEGLGGARPPRPAQDQNAFLETLWARDGKRIATRFSLETVLETVVTLEDGKTEIAFTNVSARTPVNIEVRIEPSDPLRQDIGLLRPEAFEWPVHLELPAHLPGQVAVATGFARFRTPPAGGMLADLLDAKGSGACQLVRDPERRILTELRFDAVPGFAATAMGIDKIHAGTVAGFDVHELDLDELAALDTAAVPPFERNATTWRRARRVARIERVSREMARLLPDNNRDWQGWQAHYPSETWRLEHRASGHGPGAIPRRAAWYSAADTAPEFAARVPRMRLFPTASEAAVPALLEHGVPDILEITLKCAVTDKTPKDQADTFAKEAEKLAREPMLALINLDFGAAAVNPSLELPTPAANGTLVVQLPQTRTFTPALLRAALLGLLMQASSQFWERIGAGALSLSVGITGKRTDAGGIRAAFDTGSVDLPLNLAGPLHPILEEVLGELEYGADSGRLYRRYTIAVQPVPAVEANTVAGFLAATGAGTDPWGWATLQQLGLACTVKMYDRDEDRFLTPQAAILRIQRVFAAAMGRYVTAVPVDPGGERVTRFGQPFVDILLRPGRDRRPGPFDAVLSGAGAELESDDLRLDDDALAIAQLSLRPAPAPVRHYAVLAGRWEAATWPTQLKSESSDTHFTSRILTGYELEFAPGSAGEVICLKDGSRTVLDASNRRVGLPSFPKRSVRAAAKDDPALTFFMRQPPGAALPPVPVLKARVHTIVSAAGQKTAKVTEELLTLEDLKQYVAFSHGEESAYPHGNGLQDQKGDPAAFLPVDAPYRLRDQQRSPYERFGALQPEEWATILGDSDMRALASLRANLDVALPATREDTHPAAQSLAAAYVPWMHRFLDHAAGPGGAAADIRFALAAPSKADPLRLASDADGTLTVSLLHSDRWAHARVYAVRPTPRYQNLALGAGCYRDQTDSEQLVSPYLLTEDQVPTFAQPVGYAVSTSPRTERIEPPVILGSRIVNDDENQGDQWEVVVARHGEEALAFSNRSLFARLGTEGTAITFVREYRDPDWPRRLASGMAAPAACVLYPGRTAALPAQPAGNGIDGATLGALATRYPSLWKGADVWRIGQLPAHYRVGTLAVARAGLVVSRAVMAVQDATPRRPLNLGLRVPDTEAAAEAAALLGTPSLTIVRNGGTSSIRLTDLRLVSHADVSQKASHAWFSGVDDVAWWPDPNVRYVLLRRGELGTGRTFEDEDAEVALVAAPLPDEQAASQPLVVRCRGTRFVTAATPPAVSFHDAGNQRSFQLAFELGMNPSVQGAAQVSLRLDTPGTEAETIAFNKAGVHFADIVDDVAMRIDFSATPLPASVADVPAWLRDRAAELDAWAGQLTAQANLQPVTEVLNGLAQQLRTDAGSLPPGFDVALLHRPHAFALQLALPFSAATQATAFTLAIHSNGQTVRLRDLPTAREADDAQASKHPAAQAGGRLWRACRERLLGAGTDMAVRAVDTRNAIEKEAGGTGWTAPGEMEIEVKLPNWVAWV